MSGRGVGTRPWLGGGGGLDPHEPALFLGHVSASAPV
jgi:hypothetical protein